MASACSVAIATSEPKLIGTDFLRTPAVGNCILVTIALVCTCFLVVCGVLIVREYSLASSYAETRCRLRNITNDRHETWVSCMFCAGLRDKSKDKAAAAPACVPSQFPCVRLVVLYAQPLDKVGVAAVSGDGGGGAENDADDTHGNSRHVQQREAVMHPDSLQATGPFSQCSYSVCLRNKEDSQKAVDAYVEEWRSKKNSKFTCFYDTHTLDTVIVQKMYTTADVVHSMLWPSLTVVACGAIFLRMEMRRRRLTLCGRAGPAEGSTEQSNDLVLVTRPMTHPPGLAAAAGGGGGIGSFSTTCDGVGRKIAVARAGRPAVVYQSLPSLIHLQVTETDELPVCDRHGHWINGSHDGPDERHQARRAPPVSPVGGVGEAVTQRHHHHHHQHHYHNQQNNQNHEFKHTLIRKLSASMDRFEKTAVIGESEFSVRDTDEFEVAAEGGCNEAISGHDQDARR